MAPTSFICAVCDKTIGRYSDYITCNDLCKNNYHINCIDISIEKLTKMKEENKVKTWKCLNCTEVESVHTKIPSGNEAITKEIIQGMSIEDLIEQIGSNILNVITISVITPLKDEIKLLSQQNLALSKEVEALKSVIGNIIINSTSNPKVESSKNPYFTHPILTSEKEKSAVIKKDTMHANINKQKPKHTNNTSNREKVNTTYSEAVKNCIENTDISNSNAANSSTQLCNSDPITVNEGNFTTVRRKRPARITATRGTATDLKLKGAIQYGHFYLSGMDVSTTKDDIISYLKSKNFSEVKCENMTSKRPEEYLSFKISVPIQDSENINKSELWPSGARINKYFFHQFMKKIIPK